jgi:DNA-binding NtrC family response regulator
MSDEKSLLFVDDEEEILDILVDLFSEEGYQLHTAKRAADALQIVEQHAVDFVLSDLKLPDASGSDLLNQIRLRNPNSVRVLTSGYLDLKFGLVAENEKDGTLYLSKPWDLLTLKQLVSERLGN